jgi:hypothetical protein
MATVIAKQKKAKEIAEEKIKKPKNWKPEKKDPKDEAKKKKNKAEQEENKRPFKDHFFIHPSNQFLQAFENYMLFVIAYSCFTSAYYVAFSFPKDVVFFELMEHLVFASYASDIIINFMKLPADSDPDSQESRNHLAIMKRYLRSGWFFLDLIATFPFYLFELDAAEGDEAASGNSFGPFFKLLRMVRLPKILALVEEKRFDTIIESMVRRQSRGK